MKNKSHHFLTLVLISAQHIPMASYPVEHMYDAYGKPIGHPDYPGFPMVPQYPGVPHQYPMMHHGPYPPNPPDAGYSQAGIRMASVRDRILSS